MTSRVSIKDGCCLRMLPARDMLNGCHEDWTIRFPPSAPFMTGFREKGPLLTQERTLAFSIHMGAYLRVQRLVFIGVGSIAQVNSNPFIHEAGNLLQVNSDAEVQICPCSWGWPDDGPLRKTGNPVTVRGVCGRRNASPARASCLPPPFFAYPAAFPGRRWQSRPTAVPGPPSPE